jgi:hypothetical protein
LKLTQEHLHEIFTLNVEKGELYWKIRPSRWSQVKPKDLAGSLHKDGYWRIQIKGKTYRRARLIFLFIQGYLPRQIDHKNHNTLDDQPSNLRNDEGKNQINKPKQKNNTTGFKGVCFNPRSKIRPYYTMIRINGKKEYLACFSTAEEAYILYCFAAIFYYGEFACG